MNNTINSLLRLCPESYSKYCYNEGVCYAAFSGEGRNFFRPFCKCAKDFHGPHCEYLFNPDVYGFSVSEELENKALTTVAIILFLVIIGLIWCLVLHRGYIRTRFKNGYENDENDSIGHAV